MEEEDPKYAFVIPKWVRHSNHPINTISVHPSGEIFATGGWDNYVKIWSFKALKETEKVKNKLVALLRDHNGTVNCVRFSPDGKFLATCGDDSMMFLWQKARSFGPPSTFGVPASALRPNNPIQKWTSKAFSGHSAEVTGVSWSPDSKRIASCSIDNSIIVWDVASNSQIWTYRAPVSILSISWDPLNRFIASQLTDGPIHIIDVKGKLVKEIHECLDNLPDRSMFFRIGWTPDGSFVGAASGFHEDSFNAPFFQRDSFKFSFSLDGHISPISCISSSPYLYHLSDGENNKDYYSLIAIADKKGVVSLWQIGYETKPLIVFDRLSSSSINDISWSKDGNCILISLESDPIQHLGGIICIKLLDESLRKNRLTNTEIEEVKNRLLGQTTLRFYSTHKDNKEDVAKILQSINVNEKEVDLEVLQLSTEEVMKRQIETINEEGIHIIQPVLLTAVEKQMISFQCDLSISSKQISTKVPYEFVPLSIKWTKPSSLICKPIKTIELDDSYIIACDSYIYKLNKINGRRLTPPFYIGSKCRDLSVEDDIVLAVGDKCYLLDLNTMKCVCQYICPEDFTDFGIIAKNVIIAHSKGKSWIYDHSANSWVGGGITNTKFNVSMEQIEAYAKWNQKEIVCSQWHDFDVDCMFAAYCGQTQQVQTALDNLKNQCNEESRKHVESLEKIIQTRWS
ncbi:protein HIRA-like [Histomonas meleagridis]|uniref:protein HIRA-like n=1 Tax=Histomonas meleagridis TaxID=135588 RepID=UPI00355982BF|nr:protein HIRA-like [Histomonas meleagridis]KAH0804155.1 protein HIRA-like [Histomonas meleagridis]